MGPTVVVWDLENIKNPTQKVNISYQMNLIAKDYGTDVSHVGFVGDFSKKDKNNFFRDRLARLGMRVELKRPKKCQNPDGREYYEADMDAEIVTFLLSETAPFDNIVMVSGDGDMFHPLLKLEREGKNITVFSLKGRLSKKLKRFKTRYITGITNATIPR